MLITQVYQLANDATKELLGESALISEDWSNIVDVGDSIANIYNDAHTGYEKFYGVLANRIARMWFVTRPYTGKYRNLFRDVFEFGSIVTKVQADLMEATENESWEIVNGSSVDPFVINLPTISTKFYNKAVTFEIDITMPIDQIKQSFKSQEEMARFVGMLDVMINNSMELKIEAFAERAIANLVGATIAGNASARVIHLVTDYNADTGLTLTSASALLDPDFLRYAVARMMDYKAYLKDYTSLYNEGGKPRHTPESLLHVLVNSTFASRVKTHLQSSTYHDELVKLPEYEEVARWQGVGTSGTLADRTTIKADVVKPDGTTASVDQDYVVGAMFDHDAVGILQPDRKVTTAYNAKGEYINSFHKWISRFFNDFDEQCVVFLLD